MKTGYLLLYIKADISLMYLSMHACLYLNFLCDVNVRLHSISPVQIMCVLINIASASEKTRDTMAERDDILNVLATTLVHCHIYHTIPVCVSTEFCDVAMH